MADQFTTAAQMRETTKMLMQPNANWEEYLTPAPRYIAIMGEFVFFFSGKDFSINKNAPKGGYKYIRYPDSFRACLMQICDSGEHAFNEALKNMEQLRIYTGKVPGYINTVVHTLFNGNDKVIETLLPHQLENIREIADDCVMVADGVEKKYSDVINLIQELLEAYAQHFSGEDMEKAKRILEEAKPRKRSAQLLNEWSKEITKPPMMYKQQSTSSESKSAGQRAAENARLRIEQSREQLRQSRELYEKCMENMEKNEKELTDILIEMQSRKIKEIDFETTIKMLVKGLDAMGRVKEQWEKMVLFFQMVSNIVKISLSKTLHNFVTTSEDTKQLTYNDKLFNKDLLYNQAFQASNIASLVHMISSTYTEVSNQYLMDRVSSLGRLMAMDKEKPEFLIEHQNLQESCWKALEGILRLVLKNKNEFERQTDARMEKIEGELKAILPAAQPQETERLKEIVQGGFSEEEQADYI